MAKHTVRLLLLTLMTIASAGTSAREQDALTDQALADLRILAADAMQGRKPGTEGHQAARDHIGARFARLGLKPFSSDYLQAFSLPRSGGLIPGYNVIGWVAGSSAPERYIVITAHYDHLGTRGSRIFNGADDNASGVAALLAVASRFTTRPPHHSMIFVATDGEEAGLYGSQAFVETPPVPVDQIILNINLDMLGDGGRRRELYVLTERKSRYLKDWLAKYTQQLPESGIRLKIIHQRYSNRLKKQAARIDWHRASDHYSFARQGIPYVYFGTDESPHYHRPEDDFDHIDEAFYVQAVSRIIHLVTVLDAQLSALQSDPPLPLTSQN